jgi:hypothetical protein
MTTPQMNEHELCLISPRKNVRDMHVCATIVPQNLAAQPSSCAKF